MVYLIVGLVLFVGVHCIPMSAKVRAGVVSRVSEAGYLTGFSLISLAGLVLMVLGVMNAEFVPLWTPPTWGHSLAMIVVPVGLFLVIASQLPSKTREWLVHPMLMGIALWGLAHLVANGDRTGLLLFGGFLGYSALALLSVALRRQLSSKPGRLTFDVLALVVAVIASLLLIRYHAVLFGVAIDY